MSEPRPTTPSSAGADASNRNCNRSVSNIQTHPHGRARRRHMKRTRSAPDCKHGVASKIKVGVCAMDKKAKSKPMSEILARLTAGGEFEVVTFGDQAILNEPVESWPLCDVLLSWHSEGFPLRKAQAYVELRRPFLINDVHSQDLLLDRRRVYKTLMEHNIPIPRHILVNREPAPVPEPSSEPPEDIDELTTSSSSAGSSPQRPRPKASTAAKQPPKEALPAAPADSSTAAAATPAAAAATAGAPGAAPEGAQASAVAAAAGESSPAASGELLLDPPGFIEEEDYVELDGVRIDKPFVEKPVSGEDHNIHIYYPHSMGGGVKRLFRKVDNKSADYDPHHPGTVRRDGSYIYEEFLTTGGTDVKVYTVGPRYAHAEARKSPVVDGKVNRTPDGKEVRFPVLLSPQEKEIARMVCLAFGQRVCGFDLLRSETGRSYVCDVNGWSFVKNSKKYYDDAAGILRVMILSQLAPQRLTAAPDAPMPLAGLLEEVAAAQAGASGDGQLAKAAQSIVDSEDGSGGGLRFREPSISAAAQPAELGWEQQPSALAVDVDGEGSGMKEASSLQDLTSLDGTYEEEGMGTDDSSSTGVAASDVQRNLELRCVLAVVRHGDRTPKQKMKVTVTQAPLIGLYNKYKDSKGKQAKLKSPGQLQELLDVVRALLADMEAKSSSQRSSRSSTPAPGSQLTEEEKAQEQHEELREKLRIVRTVLEQGGTFAGINRKVQLKPTKWSTASSSASKPQPADPAENQQNPAQQNPAEQQAQQPQQAAQQGSKGQLMHGDGTRSARTSSTGGTASAAGPADGKPHVTELLLILKYGGVLTHAGRAQAEDLGKTFRMVMYPRYGPAGGGGFLRLHSTYRHDLKIYSSDEGRVQMSAAAFIKGLLDLEGSSLTPILVSLVTKNASMLDAFGKGASDDILNAKNMLYQHLTWDPEKAVSMCSKLALPLATPAIGVTPPVSPKSTTAEEIMSPFHVGPQRSSHAGLEAGGSGNLPASNANSGVSTPTAAAAHHSSSFGHEAGIPTSGSCLDLLQQGRSTSGPRRTRASGTGSVTGEQQQAPGPQQQQQQAAITPRGGGGSSGSLVAAATANAAGLHAVSGLSKLAHSSSWGAVRAAEARAAALSGIKAMPEKPLVLLYQLVELMKVLVDQLREKCLEERVDPVNNPHHSSHSSQQEKQGEAAAGGDKAAGVEEKKPQALLPSNSARGISSSRYSSLASSPDDWRLDDSKPCSGERLLLMFDRWRKLLKSFFSEKKQQFDISKVPDIYDSAKYDAIHNSHLQLSSLGDLYRISRQLAAVVVPHEYGLDEQGKLLIGSKICSELLGKLLIDLESMKEESIVTAAIEAKTAAARSEEAGSSSRHPSRQRVASHSSVLDNSFDAFESEFGHMSVMDGRMRPPKPPGAPSTSGSASGKLDKGAAAGQGSGWAASGADAQAAGQAGSGGAVGADGQQQQQEGGEEQQPEDQQEQEQETLHRLCPTYASDINSPLRHVRTRIYFTSESHIHSLVNVLRYCHLMCPGSNSSALSSYATPVGSMSKAPSAVSVPGVAAAAAATAGGSSGVAVAAAGGSGAVAAAAGGSSVAVAAAVQPGAEGAAAPVAVTATAASSSSDTAAAGAAAVGGDAAPPAPAAAATSMAKAKGTAFASPAVAAVAAAGGAAAVADGSSAAEMLAGTSSVSSTTGPQQLLTPEGQALLASTDEFDYLTHIVFRMYENKTAPVDAPERFFVEIQFSNGANYDHILVEPPRHTMPTQPRRLLTNPPGVTLQSFQELTAKYTRGKIAPCNYQLQYALRAPGIGSMALSKAPTPGMSRANSTNLGPPAPTPGLPPMPPPPAAGAAAAVALLAAGPGAAPSAPQALPASVAAAAVAAVESKQS